MSLASRAVIAPLLALMAGGAHGADGAAALLERFKKYQQDHPCVWLRIHQKGSAQATKELVVETTTDLVAVDARCLERVDAISPRPMRSVIATRPTGVTETYFPLTRRKVVVDDPHQAVLARALTWGSTFGKAELAALSAEYAVSAQRDTLTIADARAKRKLVVTFDASGRPVSGQTVAGGIATDDVYDLVSTDRAEVARELEAVAPHGDFEEIRDPAKGIRDETTATFDHDFLQH
jgi:hypothetical protein